MSVPLSITIPLAELPADFRDFTIHRPGQLWRELL